MITGASYTLCSSRFQILACLSSHSDQSSGRLQWHKLVNASLLAMILGSFSMLLGTGIQVYITLNCDANNLHCAPTGAVCSNRGTERYFNRKTVFPQALFCMQMVQFKICLVQKILRGQKRIPSVYVL